MRPTPLPPLPLHIRWMIGRDRPEVLAIENEAFPFPWSDDDFTVALRQRSVIGLTAEYRDEVVGYALYELFRHRLELLSLAVKACCRRRKVGEALLAKLASKLSPQRRTRIVANVRESNLAAQLWLAACDYRAVSVLRGLYQDTDEDAFVFVHRVHSPAAEAAA